MNQAPRATMPQSTQRTFATVIILMMLVTRLVVAQKSWGYQDDPDSLVFPDYVDEGWNPPLTTRTQHDSKLAKDLQFAKQLNSFDSVDEFLAAVYGIPKKFAVGRTGENMERSNVERPPPARCIPALQLVSLTSETDPSNTYFPPCTRINRCGGCCNHPSYSCQPTATKVRNFEVQVLSKSMRTKQILLVEEHTNCTCACIITEKDCNNKQQYNESECSCICKNSDEMEKCNNSKDTKEWDAKQCTCNCKEVQECSTGFHFDQSTCSCVLARTRFPPTRGADYMFEETQKPDVPPLIIALDPADPRRKPKEDPEYK